MHYLLITLHYLLITLLICLSYVLYRSVQIIVFTVARTAAIGTKRPVLYPVVFSLLWPVSVPWFYLWSLAKRGK